MKRYISDAHFFSLPEILHILEMMGEQKEASAVEAIFNMSADRADFHTNICAHGLARLIHPDSRVFGCADYDAE